MALQRLVMDANIVFAAFVRDGTTRRLLKARDLTLFVPEFFLEEAEPHLGTLAKRAGIPVESAREALGAILSDATVVPWSVIEGRMAAALAAMREIDERDAPYLATALAVPCDGIWSNDPHLRAQRLVPCWTTAGLLAALQGPPQ